MLPNMARFMAATPIQSKNNANPVGGMPAGSMTATRTAGAVAGKAGLLNITC